MSTNQALNNTKVKASRKNQRRPKGSRNHAGSEKSPGGTGSVLRLDPVKVERLDRYFQELAKTPKPSVGPPVLFRKTAKGTFESVGQEVDQVKDSVAKIWSLLNVETKSVDHTSSQTVDRNGILINLGALISQGVADTQRTGDSVKIQRIKLHMAWTSVANNPTPVHIVVGRSKDEIPAIANIFEQTGTSFAGLAHVQWDQRKTDRWLKSKIFQSGAGFTGYVTIDSYKSMVWDVPVDEDLLYLAGATTVTSGAIWIAAQSSLSGTGPTLDVCVRVEFVDN